MRTNIERKDFFEIFFKKEQKSAVISVITACAIIGSCLCVYIPAMQSGFIWDDDAVLTKNIILKKNGLYCTWLTAAQPNYWPMAWTSYWFEHKLWGLNPAGYHLSNILIHAICSLLIWRILLLLKIPIPWLAAIVFAVHPVNVESVAWITQRKTLLAMLFFLISLLLYLKFENNNRLWLYWLSVGVFALAMLSKGSVVALPVVLLLIAYWQRGTIERRDVLRSIPFFIISAVMSCVEIWFQYNRSIGAEIVRTDNFFARLAGAGMAVWFYIYKALLPINLIFIYPRWQINPEKWFVYIPFAILAGLFLLLLRYRQSWAKPLLFALTYYVVMLLPVLGFFNIYFMAYSLVADHYQYASIIGIIALVVSAGYFIIPKFGKWKNVIAKTICFAILAILGALTWHQCQIYKNEETLYKAVLQKNPSAWMAYNNLGSIYSRQDRCEDALEFYKQAVKIKPDFAEAYVGLSAVYYKLGRNDDAIEAAKQAIKINQNYFKACYNLGVIYDKLGRYEDAIDSYKQAIKIKPDDDAYYNLGIVYGKLGQHQKAIEAYWQTIRVRPDYAAAYNNLGTIYNSLNRYEDAISVFKSAIKIEPNLAETYCNLGFAYGKLGRYEEAADAFEQAIKLKPDYADAYYNLGIMHYQNGRYNESIEACKNTLKIQPGYTEAHYVLGICYTALGEKESAMAEYKILRTLDDSLADELFKEIAP